MTTLLEKMLTFLVPNDCIFCGKEGNSICILCVQNVVDEAQSRCYRCLVPTNNYQTCANCQSNLVAVFVLGSYENELKDLVKRLKYASERQVAADLAAGFAELLPLFAEVPTVTWAPTSHQRARQRGYDQAELIARAVARQSSLPFNRLLHRQTKAHQVGANRTQRFKQAEGMFALRPKMTAPKTVLVVDDVMTTGATLNAAAGALRRGGAEQVFGLVLARQADDASE